LSIILMTEVKSVDEIDYIATAYNQNTANQAAINSLDSIKPSLRSAATFNSILAILMVAGFVMTWFANGKNLRASMFDKIKEA
jgi:hypothetical protein